jgi:hypothetical protein
MYSSVHWGDIVNGSIASHHAASKSVASPWWGDGQFHTFTLHRTSSFLRFFIDGVQVMQLLPGETVPGYSTPIPSGGALFDHPMHVRLSLEVGGPWAGQGLAPSQYEPGDLVVDYVRSWASRHRPRSCPRTTRPGAASCATELVVPTQARRSLD